MYTLSFDIDMGSLIGNVRERAGVYASKIVGKDPTSFNRMLMTEPEEGLMTEAAKASLTFISQATRRYKMQGTLSEDGKTHTIKFTLPSNYNTDMDISVQRSVQDYMETYMLARWYEECGEAEKQKETIADAGADLQALVVFINHRKAPTYKRPKLRRVAGTNFE